MHPTHLRPALLAFLLLVLLLLLPHPAHGAPALALFEQRCESEMLPTILVRAEIPGFKVHNTVSSRVLYTRGTYATSEQAIMGVTSSSTRAEIGIEGPALVDPSGARECIAPRITVDLTYQPLDIYVAREFHPASCSYRAVYAHEMQHVKIYTDNLPKVEQRVREELVARYAGRPLYAPRDKGVALLQAHIDSWLRPLIKAELAKVELEQVALDNRAESERLSRACQGELASLMGSSF